MKSCIFTTVLPTILTFLLLVFKGQTRCSKEYDSPRGLFTEQNYDFNFRDLLVYFEFRLSSRSAMFFICHVAGLCESQSQALNSNLLRDKLKLQTEVIRAAKLKFVAESRTRVYFAQHVASTCNTVFCCEASWSQTW